MNQPGRRTSRVSTASPSCSKAKLWASLRSTDRIPIPEQTPEWLRIFADHIGAAIVNARAFEEIERLKSQLELENTLLQEEVREAGAFGEMIGQSAALKQSLRQIEMVAPTDAAVLILGESGTGKELVAREIHRAQPPSRPSPHPRQLRVHSQGAVRERIFRPCQRRIYGRSQGPRRPF